MTAPYAKPPLPHSAQDETRRVGVEVELAGMDVPSLARAVAEALEGRVRTDTVQETSAHVDTDFGSFRVELDAAPLRDRTYLRSLRKLGIENEGLLDGIEESVVALASAFVPLEIVTPPIPWDRLHELNDLWDRLRQGGGLGTGAAVRYAFGLHLNPDFPSTITADAILAHLQAFFLLEDWLLREEDVDWTRRLVPFIDPFPEAYRQVCLDPSYQPSLDALIDDYLEHSPTRNRVLDLLPLFVHLREHCLEGRDIEGADLVKPRPTFHYRLPNCELDEPGWSPARAWSNWLEVERLAVDDGRRRRMAEEYRNLSSLPFRLQRYGWLDEVDAKWMQSPA